MEVKIIGQMDNTIDHTFESANRVYDKNQLCPTIPTCGGGGIQPKVIEEKYMCRMTGRNPDNPKSRKPGLPTEQMLEPNAQGICGALTTVQKDNLVLEAKTTRGKDICSTIRSSYFKNGERNIAENVKNGKGYEGVIEIKQITKNQFYEQAIQTAIEGNAEPGDVIDAFNKKVLKNGISPTITTRPEGKKTAILPCVEIKQATKEGTIKCKVGGCYDASFPGSATPRGRVQDGGDVAPTLTAGSNENIRYVETIYRIRKLTPRECWRLMGYTDTDFDKANEVNSATQLYKQAGNAIVKQVLMAIFAQMIPESARKL